MRMSSGVEWALHCCTLLGALRPDQVLTAPKLAEFHEIPAPYLAKVLRNLTAAGILSATEGRQGGYRLARDPHDITLLQIVNAAERRTDAFRCEEIRRRGPCAAGDGYTTICGLAGAMYRAEAAWRKELARQTLAHVCTNLNTDVPTAQRRRVSAWLAESTHQSAGGQ